MYRSLTLNRFRAFRELELQGLGRVNLLVGTNNSGKTCVLEAIHCLASRDPFVIWSTLRRRGEILLESAASSRLEAEVCHLFNGRELENTSELSISGDAGGQRERLTISVRERSTAAYPLFPQQLSLVDEEAAEDPPLPGRLDIHCHWSGLPAEVNVRAPLSRAGGLHPSAWQPEDALHDSDPGERPVRMVTAAALGADEVAQLLDAVVLTPAEETLIRALQTIEPNIARVASLGTARRSNLRTASGPGIVVGLTNSARRVPIGSMGDGIWRMLGIALCMVQTPGGIVLIDEIDTGLHYSVMKDMWRLVYNTAKALDIQVFATTHSRDCFEALAAIAAPTPQENTEVSIQRVERDRGQTIAFSDLEIRRAAERGIEVR